MRYLFFLVILAFHFESYSQTLTYSTSNAHSHNDYERDFPLWDAWKQGVGSIEADIFLENDELIVAHDRQQVKQGSTLDSLYLQPLMHCLAKNKGFVYADSNRTLQLMIDIKTAALPTLSKLVEKLREYPSLINTRTLKIVISGNRPDPSAFNTWPSWIWFDGELNKAYTKEQLAKIEMLSDNFSRYSSWNGKGRLPEKEKIIIQGLIAKAHEAKKKIRFWNAPDILNSWYAFIDMGIDYINTDHVEAIGIFFQQLPDRKFTNDKPYTLYQPQWRNDGMDKPVRNVILLIGDGTGLPQWYAGYTANGGRLNVFHMRQTGFSKTSSYDNYITDSAPGATAFSSGEKTNNRAVGVDHTGQKLTLLPEILRRRKMKTGIITSGDFRDATPAAFYAHQSERSNYKDILKDIADAPIDLIAGACDLKEDSILILLKKIFSIIYTADSIVNQRLPVLVADKKAALAVLAGRGDWTQRTFQSAVKTLGNKDGFFLVLEAAQIDHGGHANKLPYVVTELLDFDKVIGEAMQFADSNGETLVIVTGDHETGGLTLTGGDYERVTVSGQFSTSDHTAVPVPVFAYGPQSQLFTGVYENTEIFHRIIKALHLKK